ncbi:unnamed protein product, partial [Arabidopsis halleri]
RVFQINRTKEIRRVGKKDRKKETTVAVRERNIMAVGINALAVTFVAHALAVIAAIMVLV